MPGFNATHEEIAYCLGHFYPTMIWTLTGTDYEGLFVHPESPVPKPSLQEIQGHLPEARQLIQALRAYEAKVSAFQQTYDLQKQFVNLISAIYDPATTNIATLKANPTLTDMKNLWVSL